MPEASSVSWPSIARLALQTTLSQQYGHSKTEEHSTDADQIVGWCGSQKLALDEALR